MMSWLAPLSPCDPPPQTSSSVVYGRGLTQAGDVGPAPGRSYDALGGASGDVVIKLSA